MRLIKSNFLLYINVVPIKNVVQTFLTARSCPKSIINQGFCSVFVCVQLCPYQSVFGLPSTARGLFPPLSEDCDVCLLRAMFSINHKWAYRCKYHRSYLDYHYHHLPLLISALICTPRSYIFQRYLKRRGNLWSANSYQRRHEDSWWPNREDGLGIMLRRARSCLFEAAWKYWDFVVDYYFVIVMASLSNLAAVIIHQHWVGTIQ